MDINGYTHIITEKPAQTKKNRLKNPKIVHKNAKLYAEFAKLYLGAPILLSALLVDVSETVLRNTSDSLR